MRNIRHTLITGGAGFIGSNLADSLLADGHAVVVVDSFARAGARLNAAWLRGRHDESRLSVEEADVRDAGAMRALVRNAERIYHLAAQVAVTTSLDDPAEDLQVNLLGTFNLLEAARARPTPPPLLFTSTNKVYGSIPDVPTELTAAGYAYADGRLGIAEGQPLDFHSPYGCSKGAADQYVHDYARIFGVPTVVFRMSCIYGSRQFGTEDQGWVAHFARTILAERALTIYGDGHQVRDILWIDDLVRAMRAALDDVRHTAGEVFNLGGGLVNAVSVRGVVHRLMEITGHRVPIRFREWRPGDQRVYVSDTRRIEERLGWQPATHWATGLERLVDWLRDSELALAEAPLAVDEPRLARAAP